MTTRPFDYTTARMGARTTDGKVVLCPKCGRKGAMHIHLPTAQLPRHFTLYAHKGSDGVFHQVTECCLVSHEEGP